MSNSFVTSLNKRDIFINDSFLIETVFKQIRRFDFDCTKNKWGGSFQDFKTKKTVFSRYYECWFNNWLEIVSKITVLQKRHDCVNNSSYCHYAIKKCSPFIWAKRDKCKKNRSVNDDDGNSNPDPKYIICSILFFGSIQLWLIFQLFLRGLISNLSLATKFYSFPRRPNFLGLLVSKSRQAHYPRLSDSLKRSSALSKFLNSLVPFSFGYIDPCRHLFSFFGNRTDFSAALFFIPDRRLYE